MPYCRVIALCLIFTLNLVTRESLLLQCVIVVLEWYQVLTVGLQTLIQQLHLLVVQVLIVHPRQPVMQTTLSTLQ